MAAAGMHFNGVFYLTGWALHFPYRHIQKVSPYHMRGRRMGMRIKIRSRKEEFIKSRLVHLNIFKDRAIRLCQGTRCLFLAIQTGIINNTALRLPVQERRQHRLYIISLLQLFKLMMVNEWRKITNPQQQKFYGIKLLTDVQFQQDSRSGFLSHSTADIWDRISMW